MKFSDNVSMAFRDLNRRKKRTFLTSLGIIVGTILIILMVSLGFMIKGFLVATVDSGSSTKNITVSAFKSTAVMPTDPKEMAKEMPIWMKENFKPITNNALLEISKLDGVSGIQAYIGGTLAQISLNGKTYYGNFPIKGYDLNYNDYSSGDVSNAKSSSKNLNFEPIIAGTNLTKNDENGVVVGQALLSDLGVNNPNDIIGKTLTFDINNIEGKPVTPLKMEFKVIGVMSKYMPDGNKFVMSSNKAAKIVGFLQYTPDFMKTYGYNGLTVEANNINNVATVQKGIENIGYMATSNQQKVDSINQNFDNIVLVLSILGIIVLIVAAIGIVNTMIMVVTERTKSIGVMRSVGASSGDIRSMFLVQSGAIGFVGGVIGSIISVVIFKIISFGIMKMLESQGQSVTLLTNVPLWLIGATILFAIVVSIIAGVYPAARAAKLDPIKALRQ
ncbi:MAG: ABC transporter permease [Sarcina sp.]